MGLFSRKQPAPGPTPVVPVGPSAGEIDAAARALAQGDMAPAERLAAGAGDHGQAVAMQILTASIDHTPQD
ncbi:hypothetical protein GCM10010387_43760 [Streptomyces inusitatus]|uniref:Uncharacterized protein n=1 Tax=Streptomyces inusitatus TaxID=68221 RepID=A0A918QEG1_9ACTN|nr:hypothetical protein [Streptomyces inusitatus]GGZ44708.1 hypothetical protein GCM10010387_43760 [Streptomyces inusitatus]